MKLPVTFKEFAKDPVKAMLFILICVVMWMYNDQRTTSKESYNLCNERVLELEKWKDNMTAKLIDANSE